MTNEQRVRVDRLERYLITDREKTYTTVRVNDLDTVLSLIKEQQGQWEEIEGLKNINKNQSKDIIKAVDYTFELNKALERKDKQIDLMAKFIENNMSEKKIINEICIKSKCNNEECHEDDLKDCIKQYFAGLVEKE